MLRERTSHIRHGRRRRKVYFLTDRGRNRAASLRATLLRGKVPFRSRNGEIHETSLTEIYQEHRRGRPLCELLLEMKSFGCIAEEAGEETGVVDFVREAPTPDQFYGREEEVNSVLGAVNQAPLVVITGMAGIGKTALGSKVCELLRGEQSLFWRDIRSWDGALGLALHLGRFLSSLGRVGLHSALLGTGPKALSRIEELLQEDLAGIEALLVFDDVHKATGDVSSFLAILLRVLKGQAGMSVLLLSRAVPGFYSRREVDLENSVVELSLKRLSEEASHAILAGAGVAEPLIGPLIKAAGGNPLFLRLLSATTAPGDPEGRSLEVYIAEEIEPGLSRPERRCLEVAALYEFPVPPSGLLIERSVRTATLVALRKKGLLDRVDPNRLVLHDTLRSYFGRGVSQERLEEISGKIVPWLRETAQNLAEAGSPDDGIAYAQNAVTIDANASRRVSSLEILGRLRRFVGDYPGAMEAYQTALRQSEGPEVRARLHRKIALCHISQGNLQEAEDEIDAGLALLPPEPSREAAWLYQQRASVAYSQLDFDRCLGTVNRVLAWQPSILEDPDLHGFLLNLRALVYIDDPHRNDPALAQADLKNALKAFENARNQRGLTLVYNNLGIASMELGRNEEAFAYLDQAEATAREAGDYPAQGTPLLTKAFALMDVEGDYEAAEATYQKSYKIHKETHQGAKTVWHYWHFSELYRRQGRFEEARESLEYFLQASGDIAGREFRAQSLGLMIRLCVLCGDGNAAEAYFEEAWSLVQEVHSELAECAVEWAKATLLAWRGDTENAELSFRRASKLSEPHQRGEALLDYGRFLNDSGKPIQARKAFAQASEDLGSTSKALGRSAIAELESLDLAA